MQVRFLHSPELIVRYTMGDCKALALALADRLNGKIVAIGSDNFKNYPVLNFSADGEASFEIYNNPMHYVCMFENEKFIGKFVDEERLSLDNLSSRQTSWKFADIYGVFETSRSLLDHYNNFYRNYLTDIGDEINMKFWDLNDKECKGEVDQDIVDFIVSNIHSQGYAFLNDEVTEEKFNYAMRIVFDLKENEISSPISEAAMNAVYCLPMNLFDPSEVFEPWFHQPWEAPSNILMKVLRPDIPLTYKSMLREDQLNIIKNESLFTFVVDEIGGDVERELCYELYFDLLKNPTYRDLLGETEFHDHERSYVKNLILISKSPLKDYDHTINKNIRERLLDPILEMGQNVESNFHRLGLDTTDVESLRDFGAYLEKLLIRLNKDKKFLLGIMRLPSLAWLGDKIGFRHLENSIMYSDDFIVDRHRRNEIYDFVEEKLPHHYYSLLKGENYVSIDMACYWYLVNEFLEKK